MSPLRLTASKLGHAMACAWPFRPDVDLPPEGPPHPSALTGRAFASLRANYIDPTRAVDLPAGADEPRARRLFEVWRAWWETYRGVATWETEVPLAINLATGEARRLPSTGQRDYSAALSTEVVGTADVLGRDHEGVVVLDDKTGSPEYVDPVGRNWQLRMLALAAARASGVDHAQVGLVFVGDDAVTYDSAELDAMDLDAIETDLRALVARIPGAEPTPGEHCRFCPARAVCPAFSAAVAEVADTAPAALATIARSNGALTSAQVAAAWPQFRLVEAGLDQIKAAIRAYVAEHGDVPLASGKRLRLVESARSTISGKSIRDALGPGPGGEVIAMLEARGAVTTSTSVSLREVKP